MEGIKFEKVSFGTFLKDALSCAIDQRVEWDNGDTDHSNFSDYLKYIYANMSISVIKVSNIVYVIINITLFCNCLTLFDMYL